MAKFKAELPTEFIKHLEKHNKNVEKVMGEMTQAGAKVYLNDIETNVPASFRNSNIMKCLKMTKVYKTPSDEGINTRVGFRGYFINSKGEEVASEMVVNVFEYGSSKNKKKPFMRKSFNKAKIERAMEEVFEKNLPKELK